MKATASLWFAGLMWLGLTSVGWAQMGYGPPPMYGGPMMLLPSAGYGYVTPAGFQGGPQGAPGAMLPAPDPSCSSGSCGTMACEAPCGPCWQVWGEFLVLRPRDGEVAWAVPFNGPVVRDLPPVQIGPVAVADPDYEPGFRVGIARALDECSSIGVSYTWFESTTNSTADATAADGLYSMVFHPATIAADASYLRGDANLGIDFQLADAEFRSALLVGECYSLNYVVGGRYARLNQDFQATFLNNGVEDVITRIDFDGGGIRLGLEGERNYPRSGLLVYGRGNASFVVGDFQASYFQGSSVDETIVQTSWTAGRVVSILDAELGVGWRGPCGRLQITAGYLVSAWCNAVETDEWIQAVQTNNFVDLGDTLTFDGFVGRAEFRW